MQICSEQQVWKRITARALFDNIHGMRQTSKPVESRLKPELLINSSKILDGGRSKNWTVLRRGYTRRCIGRPRNLCLQGTISIIIIIIIIRATWHQSSASTSRHCVLSVATTSGSCSAPSYSASLLIVSFHLVRHLPLRRFPFSGIQLRSDLGSHSGPIRQTRPNQPSLLLLRRRDTLGFGQFFLEPRYSLRGGTT